MTKKKPETPKVRHFRLKWRRAGICRTFLWWIWRDLKRLIYSWFGKHVHQLMVYVVILSSYFHSF